MSFLNLRRLLPTRKVWKILTKKLQIKLHKLNRSKAITMPKYRATNKLGWPLISTKSKKLKLKRRPHTSIHLQRRTPVYVDRLLIDSKKERNQPRVSALAKEAKNKNHLEKRKAIYDDSCMPESRKARSDEADDMWESMVIASPHNEGINQRAEDFIARFRAQMHHQEMLARHL